VSDRDQREEMPAEVRAAMRKLSPRTRDLVRAVAAGMAHHVRELQARVAELEARPHLHDAGVWDEQKVYGINAIVTDHGSAWIAKRATCRRPGDGNDDWRLLVKRGRDGKGAARPIVGRVDG
jgi:hypothetical protein